MGWFKMTGTNPSPNSVTANPADRYNAVGLAGVLSGNSDGHGVRALLELIDVNGELRLVALGRRIDTGASQTFAASADWQSILPQGEWVHLAATFDYTTGEDGALSQRRAARRVLHRRRRPVAASTAPVRRTRCPRGIKIGGSFPQDTVERNPCNCRMDSLMFLDRAVTSKEVARQYRRFVGK